MQTRAEIIKRVAERFRSLRMRPSVTPTFIAPRFTSSLVQSYAATFVFRVPTGIENCIQATSVALTSPPHIIHPETGSVANLRCAGSAVPGSCPLATAHRHDLGNSREHLASADRSAAELPMVNDDHLRGDG